MTGNLVDTPLAKRPLDGCAVPVYNSYFRGTKREYSSNPLKVARLDFLGGIPPKFDANSIFLLNLHVHMKLENNGSE